MVSTQFPGLLTGTIHTVTNYVRQAPELVEEAEPKLTPQDLITAW